MLHALSRGISALVIGSDKKIEWIEEALYCHKCEASGADLKLTPAPITRGGRVADEATGIDALLCDECRREM